MCLLNKNEEQCEKCLKPKGKALVTMYKVLVGRFVKEMHGEPAFVSFAGIMLGVNEMISTPLSNL